MALRGGDTIQVTLSQVAKMLEDLSQEAMLPMAHAVADSDVHPLKSSGVE